MKSVSVVLISLILLTGCSRRLPDLPPDDARIEELQQIHQQHYDAIQSARILYERIESHRDKMGESCGFF